MGGAVLAGPCAGEAEEGLLVTGRFADFDRPLPAQLHDPVQFVLTCETDFEIGDLSHGSRVGLAREGAGEPGDPDVVVTVHTG